MKKRTSGFLKNLRMKHHIRARWKAFLKFELSKYEGDRIYVRGGEYNDILIHEPELERYIIVRLPKCIIDKLIKVSEKTSGDATWHLE